MPELLEPAAKPPGIPFNPTTASAAGQRSGQVRRQHAAILAGKPISLPVLPPVNQVERTTNAQLDLVANQIKRTRDVLNDNDYRYCEQCERGGVEPQHRAQLLKALDVLLDRQRVLLGIPLPGSRRPAPEGSARHARAGAWLVDAPPEIQVAPVAESPAFHVEPAAPSRPIGWEYDPPTPVPEVPPASAGQAPGDVTP